MGSPPFHCEHYCLPSTSVCIKSSHGCLLQSRAANEPGVTLPMPRGIRGCPRSETGQVKTQGPRFCQRRPWGTLPCGRLGHNHTQKEGSPATHKTNFPLTFSPGQSHLPNQSILKEISPEYSLEGLMLKLKLQYFGHLM